MIKKVYVKTFGCQMNEYDSDKMADVLGAAEGLVKTDTPEDADVILFNTCSVREKAQEKVFPELGRVRELKRSEPGPDHRRGRLRGQPGRRRDRRARALRRRGVRSADPAPSAADDRQRAAKAAAPQVDISFPEIEKFDHLPPARVDGPSAFVSIMEGCSKYCSFCVVPYTRGEEVSRPLDDVLTEIAGLADQGVREVTLLGQNVNAYRGGAHARLRRDRRLRDADRIRRRDSRHRAHPLHHLASEGIHPAPDRRLRARCRSS